MDNINEKLYNLQLTINAINSRVYEQNNQIIIYKDYLSNINTNIYKLNNDVNNSLNKQPCNCKKNESMIKEYEKKYILMLGVKNAEIDRLQFELQNLKNIYEKNNNMYTNFIEILNKQNIKNTSNINILKNIRNTLNEKNINMSKKNNELEKQIYILNGVSISKHEIFNTELEDLLYKINHINNDISIRKLYNTVTGNNNELDKTLCEQSNIINELCDKLITELQLYKVDISKDNKDKNENNNGVSNKRKFDKICLFNDWVKDYDVDASICKITRELHEDENTPYEQDTLNTQPFLQNIFCEKIIDNPPTYHTTENLYWGYKNPFFDMQPNVECQNMNFKNDLARQLTIDVPINDNDKWMLLYNSVIRDIPNVVKEKIHKRDINIIKNTNLPNYLNHISNMNKVHNINYEYNSSEVILDDYLNKM